MSVIAQDLKDIACLVAKSNTAPAWQGYLNFLLALAEDTEETTIGEDSHGLKKARYYYFSDGTMLCVRGDPVFTNDYEIRAYDSIGD